MKKFLFLFLIVTSCAYAQVKVQDLTEDTTPASTDLGYSIKNGNLPRKVQWKNITKISGWQDDGTILRPTTLTDNVSIGTSASTATLTVAGTVAATAYSGSGAALTGIPTLDSNGNLGLGATPTEKLHVDGNARITGLVSCTDIGSDAQGILSCSAGGGGGGGGAGIGTVNPGSANRIAYYPGTGSTVDDLSILTTDGTNVGISSVTPSKTLDITGTLGVSGNSSLSTITSGTWNGSTIGVAYGGLNLTGASDDSLPLGNGTTWQAKILSDCQDSSGNHLNYNASTNAFSCGTSTSTGTVGWTNSGTYVYLNTSTNNVGIGTNVPAYKLDVGIGTVNAGNYIGSWGGSTIPYTRGGTGLTSALDDTIMVGNGIGWSAATMPNAPSGIAYDSSANTFSAVSAASAGGFTDDGTVVHLTTSSDNVGMGTTTPLGTLTVTGRGTAGTTKAINVVNSSYTEKFTVLDNGNLGIGTVTPRTALDVNGTISGGSGSGSATVAGATNLILSGDGAVTSHVTILSGGNTGIGTTLPSSLLEVGARKLNVLTNGNVGIGSITPGKALDVQGTIRTTSFVLSTNPASNYVLTSDSVGVGTWVPSGVSGLTANYIPKASSATSLGNSQLFDNGTNVGIGSTVPGIFLDVAGAIRSTGAGTSNFTGNVGIGSLSPGQPLDVNGAIRTITSGNSTFGGNIGIGTSSGVPNALYVVGTPMFTTGLNIGIGTASLTRLCIAGNAVSVCP